MKMGGNAIPPSGSEVQREAGVPRPEGFWIPLRLGVRQEGLGWRPGVTASVGSGRE